jgi:hypothetical protein
MKTPFNFSILGIATLMLLGGTGFAATPAKPTTSGKTPPAPNAKPAKRALTKGMTADAIKALIGRPREIKPMKAPAGKAEVWIYRRVTKELTRQTAASMQTVPAFVGVGMGVAGDGMGSVSVPEFRLEHIKIYQVTRLLMFNDKLVTAKQWFEKESSFD